MGSPVEINAKEKKIPEILDSCLYIIATPIGNLEDMSPRAVRTLANADLILCEDTRQLRKLLLAFDITAKSWLAYHDHNEQNIARDVIARMQREPMQVALVSDSGTPCISDPGYRITALAHEQGVRVSPVPGASAPIALLSSAGLASDRFYFSGFLPRKTGELHKTIAAWQVFDCVILFFESGKRILQSLEAIKSVFPGSRLALGREISKLHEDIIRFSIDDAMEYLSSPEKQRGEFVIALEPNVTKKLDAEVLKDDIRKELREGLSSRDILDHYTKLGYNKKELYALILRLKMQ